MRPTNHVCQRTEGCFCQLHPVAADAVCGAFSALGGPAKAGLKKPLAAIWRGTGWLAQLHAAATGVMFASAAAARCPKPYRRGGPAPTLAGKRQCKKASPLGRTPALNYAGLAGNRSRSAGWA